MFESQIEWDAMDYVGDVVTRKFPFDRESLFSRVPMMPDSGFSSTSIQSDCRT